MRPWMKILSVAGVMGVVLGVSLAAEKPAGRLTLAPKKSSRPEHLEFISRPVATSGLSDEEVDPTTDVVAEDLADEVSATPKPFARSKAAAVFEDSAPTTSTKGTLKPAKTAGADKANLAEHEPSSRPVRAALKPLISNVELLSPPESSADELPPPRKLVVKKSAAGKQSAGPGAEPSTLTKSRLAATTETTEDASASGLIAADFQQKPTNKSRVRPANAEQSRAASAAEEHAATPTAAKPSRVSVVSDHAPRTTPSTLNRAMRATTTTATSDAATVGKSSPTSGTPAVSVEWVNRGEINVGQECSCDLLVKNTGRIAARAVVVDAFFPASVRLTKANPEPDIVADHLEWSIPELAAGEERTIHISMIPSQRGELATTAHVRFTGTAASVFKVAEPLLKVTTEAPAEVLVGDPLVQTVTLTNPGTGIAQHVKIQVATPEGLEATRNDRSTIEIGALNPGESRTVRLSFTAVTGGEQTLGIEATADSGLYDATEATVNVIAPILSLTMEGPGTRYAGRDARYALNIINEGKAATNNVHVTHRIPKGFKFVKADKGGTFDANTNSVNWFIAHLEPQQSAQVKLNLLSTELGQFEHQAIATAEHGVAAKAATTTKIEGSAVLALEIQDLEDPVEVGQETAYEVRVSNTGSKAAVNVGVTFELPSGVELLNVQSPAQHFAKNGLILFNDLPELAPGKTALFRIHVRGTVEGNQRVRARLTCESIDQPIVTEELTKFSAE